MLSNLFQKFRSDALLLNAFMIAFFNLSLGAVGFIFWIIATNRFSLDSIAKVAALTALTPLVSTFSSLGLAPAITKYFSLSTNPRSLVSRSWILVGVVGFTLGGMLGFFYIKLDSSKLATCFIVGLAVAALSCNMISTATIIASRRAFLLLYETVIGSFVKIGSVFFFPKSNEGLLLAVFFGIIASAAVSTLVAYNVLHQHKAGSRDNLGLVGFSITNWIASAVSLAPIALLPSFVLARSTPAAAAATAIAALFLPVLNLPASTITRSLFVEASAQPERTDYLVKKTFKSMLLVTGSIVIFVFIFSSPLLSLFGKNYVYSSSTLLRLLALSSFVAIGNYLADTILSIRRDNSAYLMVNLLGTLAICIASWFSSAHGAVWVGAAWIISQLVYSIIAWSTVVLRKERTFR